MRRWLLGGGLVVVLLIVALGVLARPLLGVRDDATAARTELTQALESLKSGDVKVARSHLELARARVEASQGATDGFGAAVWAHVPVVGGGVRDAGHLVDALDDATSVLESGVQAYPLVLGKRASLVKGESVDLEQLDKVLDLVARAHADLDSAKASLDQVRGTAPVLGAAMAKARDEAAARIDPAQRGLDTFDPLLTDLPRLFGAEGEATMLIAVLNPAELRYSGGAALAATSVTMRDGVATFGKTSNLSDVDSQRKWWWPKVRGNVFHKRERTYVQNATYSPYWSVSGEELLRGWMRASHGQRPDTLMVLDLSALARLFAITGPVTTEVYGELTADNLVETLAGSYDKYVDYDDRRELNATILPAFRTKFFEGGQFIQKFTALGEAAGARQFAMYSRDPGVQATFESLGIAGDLSDTPHDYLGVFSQNTNVSKVDYYQRRRLTSQVRLRADGSARVHLEIEVHNDTTPYVLPGPDPHANSYNTKWAGLSLATFLPQGVEVEGASLDQETFPEPPAEQAYIPDLRQVGDRPFVRRSFQMAPQTRTTMTLDYRVPRAAVADGDTLTYYLDVDPQAMAHAEGLSVTVRAPKGYVVDVLPQGWKGKPDVATWSTDALLESPRWELTFRAR